MTSTADPKLIADILMNLFGALGTLVLARNLRRDDPHGPMTGRILFAFYLVAALFLLRCLAWSTGSAFFAALVDLLAALTPLAALLVAEGLLRRHAPRLLKLSILGGCGVVAVLSLLPGMPTTAGTYVQLAVIAAGFGAVGILLGTRDRTSLTDGENASIRRVVIAMGLLVPLIATDFPSIWPGLPIRFGALGALVLLFFAFGPGRSTNGERVLSLLIFFVIAGLFAFGHLAAGPAYDAAQAIRALAVGMSGLIFAALFSESLGAHAERRKSADPLLAAQSREQFIGALKEHRVIGAARILEEDDIASLRHVGFDSLIAVNPVLKRVDTPWGRAISDDGVERASSLFMTYDASHVMRLSQQPMRLAIFSVSQFSSDARTESEIAAAQRIGELIFARAAPA